jgi:transposase
MASSARGNRQCDAVSGRLSGHPTWSERHPCLRHRSYIARTSLKAEVLDDAATVRSYKSLSRVERAFRCIKTVDLNVRPVHHWLAGRVRAHVFLCMLAYYLEWHMRSALAPLLFDDTEKDVAEALRASVVAKAQGFGGGN